MKERGLGTPATRAEIIETLHPPRVHRARRRATCIATPKGLQVITMLEENKLTSPELTGDWEKRLARHRARPRRPEALHHGHRRLHEADRRGRSPRSTRRSCAPSAPSSASCPRCGAETGEIIRENSKAYGCTSWKSREETGCGFVIWKRVAGRTLTPELARQLIEEGKTQEVLSGFRSRAGKPFRARLVLNARGQGRVRVPTRERRCQRACRDGITDTADSFSVRTPQLRGRFTLEVPGDIGLQCESSMTERRLTVQQAERQMKGRGA